MSLTGDITRQTAPNRTSKCPEHTSDWYLIPPSTVSLLSAWQPRKGCTQKRNGDIDVKSRKI